MFYCCDKKQQYSNPSEVINHISQTLKWLLHILWSFLDSARAALDVGSVNESTLSNKMVLSPQVLPWELKFVQNMMGFRGGLQFHSMGGGFQQRPARFLLELLVHFQHHIIKTTPCRTACIDTSSCTSDSLEVKQMISSKCPSKPVAG